MNSKDFVLACAEQKANMLRLYSDPASGAQVATLLAGLDTAAAAVARQALDVALTDAFYSVLLALDGAASLGASQQQYKLFAEDGQLLTGDLEANAYEVFHGEP